MARESGDYLNIFLERRPLLDVRAPLEFRQGAFPQAVNIPLLDDEQRRQVGLRYRQGGQQEALRLGWELATPALREQRLAQWSDFCRRNPQGYLYCFRGGLRSRIAQEMLREHGVNYPRVAGGCKAMRGFLLEQFQSLSARAPLLLLSGCTGCGKTRVLRQLERKIDLEGLARHRGSAFGGLLTPQPSQIDFEHAVALEFLRHEHEGEPALPLMLEDEGGLIGRICLPLFLREAMQRADLVVLERGLDERAQLILEDYIGGQWPEYQRAFGAQAQEKFRAFVLDNLGRIQKRLGGARYRELRGIFGTALAEFAKDHDPGAFAEGVRRLLADYYDPMYRYQLQKREGRIIFSGSEKEVLAWARS